MTNQTDQNGTAKQRFQARHLRSVEAAWAFINCYRTRRDHGKY